MNKKSVVPTPAIHPAQSDPSPARRNTEVSAQITLSDSILTGAVVEYRKAGYRFIRHMHTSIEIYRILSGECYMDIQSETIHCTEGDFIMTLICFPLLCLKMMELSRLPCFMLSCFLRIFITGSDRIL